MIVTTPSPSHRVFFVLRPHLLNPSSLRLAQRRSSLPGRRTAQGGGPPAGGNRGSEAAGVRTRNTWVAGRTAGTWDATPSSGRTRRLNSGVRGGRWTHRACVGDVLLLGVVRGSPEAKRPGASWLVVLVAAQLRGRPQRQGTIRFPWVHCVLGSPYLSKALSKTWFLNMLCCLGTFRQVLGNHPERQKTHGSIDRAQITSYIVARSCVCHLPHQRKSPRAGTVGSPRRRVRKGAEGPRRTHGRNRAEREKTARAKEPSCVQ